MGVGAEPARVAADDRAVAAGGAGHLVTHVEQVPPDALVLEEHRLAVVEDVHSVVPLTGHVVEGNLAGPVGDEVPLVEPESGRMSQRYHRALAMDLLEDMEIGAGEPEGPVVGTILHAQGAAVTVAVQVAAGAAVVRGKVALELQVPVDGHLRRAGLAGHRIELLRRRPAEVGGPPLRDLDVIQAVGLRQSRGVSERLRLVGAAVLPVQMALAAVPPQALDVVTLLQRDVFLDRLPTGVQLHAHGVMVKAVAHQNGLLPGRQLQAGTASLPSLGNHPTRLERLHAKRHGLAGVVIDGQFQRCPRGRSAQTKNSQDDPEAIDRRTTHARASGISRLCCERAADSGSHSLLSYYASPSETSIAAGGGSRRESNRVTSLSGSGRRTLATDPTTP